MRIFTRHCLQSTFSILQQYLLHSQALLAEGNSYLCITDDTIQRFEQSEKGYVETLTYEHELSMCPVVEQNFLFAYHFYDNHKYTEFYYNTAYRFHIFDVERDKMYTEHTLSAILTTFYVYLHTLNTCILRSALPAQTLLAK